MYIYVNKTLNAGDIKGQSVHLKFNRRRKFLIIEEHTAYLLVY